MLDLLMKRRSIRRYKAMPVEQEKVEELVRAALVSPSSRSINPWEFIVITEQGLLNKLSSAKEHGSKFLRGAPLGIVVLADGTKSDVWVEDTSIASIIIQLVAESMGLGSCWIQIRNRMQGPNMTSDQYVKEALAIPEHYHVEAIISVGYPDETRRPYSEEDLDYAKVHLNQFNRSWR